MKKRAIFVSILALATNVFSANPGTVSQQQFEDLVAVVAAIKPSLLFGTNYAATSTCSDASNASCLLFVTSVTVLGDMSTQHANQYNVTPNPSTGIAAANSICQQEGDARWGAGRTWLAWISDSTQNAGDSVYQPSKTYVNTSGLVVSEPGKMLLPGPSDFDAILVNAIRSADNIFYWTGTKSQGEVASFTCDNWTTSSNGQKGTQGRGYSLAVNWTGRDVTTRECDYSDYHLLCFERG